MGDTPMAMAPFIRAVLYFLMAVAWAWAAAWAAVIAAAAYCIGRIRWKPRWPLACLKAAAVPPIAAAAVWFWLFNRTYSLYAAYWALLFLLLGELYPVLPKKGRTRERMPRPLLVFGAALPVVSTLITGNIVILVLSTLCGGAVLLRGKE